jgi:hypothetical protein
MVQRAGIKFLVLENNGATIITYDSRGISKAIGAGAIFCRPFK